jgi:hypothetical protein
MTGEPLGSSDPVVEVLRSAADALVVDLAAWEARDPGASSPEARRALRAAIATVDAVIIVMSQLRSRLGGDRL